jgi:uronate dehydrogenase
VNRVLITGAAGTIGQTLRQGFQGRFGTLRLLDLARSDPPTPVRNSSPLIFAT